MLGFVGLIVSVVLFILLTFRGWNMAVASVLSSVLILLFNRMDLFKGFAESYTLGFSEFAGSWWLLFLLGTTFGRYMQDMGLSDAMARVIYARFRGRVILAVLAVSFVLSYGGIGTFVIAFTVYPIASRLFQEANISRNLLPAVMLFCPTTMCMTMLPGTPSIQNMIPTSFLGTSIYAAPLFGTVAAALTGVIGYLYFWYTTAAKQPVGTGPSVAGKMKSAPADYLSFLPCICLWGVAFFLNRVGIESRAAVAAAMAAAIGVCIVLKRPGVSVQKSINEGSMQGLKTLAATSCIMGYGALVQSTDGFRLCLQQLLRISTSPVLTSILAINVIAAVTGSSTASLQLYYKLFSGQIAQITFSKELIHRITAIASGGLDSMPYATGVAIANELAKTSLRDTYRYVFITCAMIPLAVLGVLLLLLNVWV
ncbi:GntP family permease [Faecalibacterium wellingii]|uniref:Citrate transporter-like domain-containing protein n=1 Tax=Faecalibacterium wellingii TaxID=2929491 RepID=A0ABU3U1C0_9FIRM|nr:MULTISPECIES: hypothetical protein [Faecalibacterium]MDU8689303.1 hypothetical protein [Faecalibacterium prausnitzii]UQK57109.1 hypothetical protein MTP37_03040 [Faecalibacterium sp. HTF-F]